MKLAQLHYDHFFIESMLLNEELDNILNWIKENLNRLVSKARKQTTDTILNLKTRSDISKYIDDARAKASESLKALSDWSADYLREYGQDVLASLNIAATSFSYLLKMVAAKVVDLLMSVIRHAVDRIKRAVIEALRHGFSIPVTDLDKMIGFGLVGSLSTLLTMVIVDKPTIGLMVGLAMISLSRAFIAFVHEFLGIYVGDHLE